MKKEQKQLVVLIVLLAIAGTIWYFYGRNSSVAANSALAASGDPTYTPLPIDNPSLHRDKLEASRKTQYKSNGRDLFSEIPPPPPPDKDKPKGPAGPVAPVTPPPPPPPTLGSVKFFGYGTIPNGTAKRAFLTDGEEIYIVGEGDTLLGRFRIVKIGNSDLEFEEIATGRHNTAPLEEQAAPSS